MSSASEATYLGDWLKEEAGGKNFCREVKTLLAGSGAVRTILSGTVVSLVNTVTATAGGGNTGNGTITATAEENAVAGGTYVATCVAASTDAGTFEVETPTGEQLATNVTVGGGATNVDDHLTITIADGATDFVVGDTFTLAVDDGKVVAYDDTDNTESENPIGIAVADASAADGADGEIVVLVRGPAVVTRDRLIFPSTADAAEKAIVYDKLLALGIKTVEGV